ncbi:hypothetical protein Tco_0205117 [Tanacetum coccineum]
MQVLIFKVEKFWWLELSRSAAENTSGGRGGGGRRTLAVFRPLSNIKVEFWEGELETTFVLPNSALFEIHMPWLKVGAIDTRQRLQNEFRLAPSSSRQRWITTLDAGEGAVLEQVA